MNSNYWFCGPLTSSDFDGNSFIIGMNKLSELLREMVPIQGKFIRSCLNEPNAFSKSVQHTVICRLVCLAFLRSSESTVVCSALPAILQIKPF